MSFLFLKLKIIFRNISEIRHNYVPDGFNGDREYKIYSEDYSKHNFKLPPEYRTVANVTNLFYK